MGWRQYIASKSAHGKLSIREVHNKDIALRFKYLHPPPEKPGKGVAMKGAAEFIKRMQEDVEFRQKVNACLEGEERLAFLKREGYDFSPFVQILNNLSHCHQSIGGLGAPGPSASPKPGASGFLGRLGQIFRAPKASRPDR